MIFRRPPSLANWLLDRSGYARQNTPLAGDLLEEFRNGRSAAWYWRQTLAVIANGITRNGSVLRPYLLALCAGYTVQFAVALTLWWTHSPPLVHGSVWTRFGVWLLCQLAYPGYTRLVNRLAVGVFAPNLPRMYCAVECAPPRSTVAALAAYQSFSLGLANYCLCALILPRFSPAAFVAAEMAWFVLWILTPALVAPVALPVNAEPVAAETVKDEQPWLAIPQSEPVLTVTLPDGRTINLERPGIAQSVFAAADPELIGVVFGRHRSLELVRRAIWLGGYRSQSHIQARAESLTLAELAALIDVTGRMKSVVEACYPAPRRAGLRRSFRRWFRGDPV
jgi:hypothetical protein